jgi:hypothetical protein
VDCVHEPYFIGNEQGMIRARKRTPALGKSLCDSLQNWLPRTIPSRVWKNPSFQEGALDGLAPSTAMSFISARSFFDTDVLV